MFSHLSARWLATAFSLTAFAASAQNGMPPDRGMPDGQQQPTPYRSALDGYQPFADEKIAPWKLSNDTVGKVGGWRAYAREAQEPAALPAPKAPGTAVDPHTGHKH